MKKLSLIALAAVAFLGITGSANAATPMLETGDFVGISFWLVSMGMIATTVFFFSLGCTSYLSPPPPTNYSIN